MKILIADSLPEEQVDLLRQKGDECIINPELKAEEIPDVISGVDVLVVRSTKVNSEVFERSDRLGLVVRSGAGTNTIDCKAAANYGIYVCNVPGTNSVAVAELAMGLLISVDRHISLATSDLKEGKWNKKIYSKSDGLMGKTLGIIGVGEIGLAVAERARSFGMNVLAKRAPRKSGIETRIRTAGIKLLNSLDELVEQSDVVSIHLPGSPETTGFINSEFFDLMKPGAILINTSRGEIIDEDALLIAMNEKGIRAGLDVFCDEPAEGTGEFISKIAKHPNVIGTHHIGASTKQAQDATVLKTIEVIDAYRKGNVINCVNMAEDRIGNSTIIIRHYDKVGVLAEVFEILRKENLNVETMQNKVFDGSKAALAIIDVSGSPTSQLLIQLSQINHVIHVHESTP